MLQAEAEGVVRDRKDERLPHEIRGILFEPVANEWLMTLPDEVSLGAYALNSPAANSGKRPPQASSLERVVSWDDFIDENPGWKGFLPSRDEGIDAVGVMSDGQFMAIQHKCWKPDAVLGRKALKSFLALSATHHPDGSGGPLFPHKLLVATLDKIKGDALKQLANHDVLIMTRKDLTEHDDAWTGALNSTGQKRGQALRAARVPVVPEKARISTRGSFTPIARSLSAEGGPLETLTEVCRAGGKGPEALRACVGVWALRAETFPQDKKVTAAELAAAVGFGRDGRNFRPYFRLLQEAGWLDAHGVDLTDATTTTPPAGTGGFLRVPAGAVAEVQRRAVAAGHRASLPIVGSVILLGLWNDPGYQAGVKVDLARVESVTHVSRVRRRLQSMGVLARGGGGGSDWLVWPSPLPAAADGNPAETDDEVHPLLGDGEWFRSHYQGPADAGLVADQLGCPVSMVLDAAAAHGIPAGSARRSSRRLPELADGAWLRDQYETQWLSTTAIAADLGCSPPAVWAALRRHGIETRPPGRRSGRTL